MNAIKNIAQANASAQYFLLPTRENFGNIKNDPVIANGIIYRE